MGVAASFLGCFGPEGSHPFSASLFFECTEVDCCVEEGSLCFLAGVDLAFSFFDAFNTRLLGEGAEVGIVIDTWLPDEGACEDVSTEVDADAEPKGSGPLGGANDRSMSAVLSQTRQVFQVLRENF